MAVQSLIGKRLSVWALVLVLAVVPNGLRAAITPIGDVSPTPGTSPWNVPDSTEIKIGITTNGQITVDLGSVVNSAAKAYLGYGPSTTGAVTITGAGSTWANQDLMSIGAEGVGQLTVSAGGQLTTGEGTIGGYDPFADGTPIANYFAPGADLPNGTGTATVTGTGSTWTSDVIMAGMFGNGTLNIESGGQVGTYRTFVGMGPGITGTVNVNNGTMTATDTLSVGIWGTGAVTIQGGGQVSAAEAYIGGVPFDLLNKPYDADYIPDGTGTVTVTGQGSSLTVTSDTTLFVGYSGQGTLDVELGGLVTTESMVIGGMTDASGYVNVRNQGSTLAVTNDIQIGVWADVANLTVEDHASVTAGRLQIGGLESSDTDLDQEILDDMGRAEGTGTVTVSSDGTLDVSGPAYIGYSGTGTVNVNTGGQVSTYQTALGIGPGSHGTILVDGSASKYQVTYDEAYETETGLMSGGLAIGGYGTGTVTVQNGGQMTVDDVVYVGGYKVDELPFTGTIEGTAIGTTPNGTGTLTISGSTSSLTVNGIQVGATGTGYLNVFDNATLTTTVAGIGVAPGSHGEAVVSNAPGSWTNSESMFVGGYGQGSLTVGADGHVSVGQALFIGGFQSEYFTSDRFDYGDHPNGTGTVTVTGTDAHLEAYGIGVGIEGTGTLRIENGGRVDSQLGVVGAMQGGTGTVVVDGTNSLWKISGEAELPEGLDAAGSGTVTVSNGGEIQVDGSTAVLLVADGVTVGSTGQGTMSIANGGHVGSGSAVIGGTNPQYDTAQEYMDHAAELGTGTGQVTITGDGSTWNAEETYVGFSGTGTLTVTDGQITDHIGWVGLMPNAVGTATLNGPTATWTNEGTLAVGMWGQGTLNIENGAHVTAPEASIGGMPFEFIEESYNSSLTAHGTGTVTVTGPGSTLDVTGAATLYVGYSGTGTLNVQSQGRVNTTSAVIGGGPDAVGTVTVDGEGSELSAQDNILVGAWGEGHMTISNSGNVTAPSLHIGGFDVSQAENLDEAMVADLGEAKGTGTVTVTGQGSILDVSGSDSLYVGYSGTGTLNVTAGGAATTDLALLGVRRDATGTATVDGGSSTLSASGNVVVGAWGTGNLTVSGGGQVSADTLYIGGFDPDRLSTDNAVMTGLVTELGNPTGTGHVTVTGAGSALDVTGMNTLVVGAHAGSGTLTIAAGGEVTSMDSFIGGYIRFNDDQEGGTTPEFSNGGSGTAQVTGPDSHWDTNALVVGVSGYGELEISSGGQVDSHLAGVAFGPGSNGIVTVTGPGSAWVIAPGDDPETDAGHGELIVGGFGALGQGQLTIANGGRVDARTLYIGGFDLAVVSDPDTHWNLGVPAGTGTVTVTGANSQLNVTGADTLYIGYTGTGTLTVSDGGQATSDNSFIGYSQGSTGTVQVTGADSKWNVGGNLFVGGTSEAAGGTGGLTVSDGGLVDVLGSMTVWNTGTLRGNGTLTVTEVTTLHNYGTIAPGSSSSIGTLTVNGNVVFEPGSTYAVKIGQTTSDKLEVNGDTTINGGTVKVSSLGTVVGTHDYEIIHANSVTVPRKTVPESGFDVLDTALLTFSVSDPSLTYDPTSVTLHLVAANFNDPTIAHTPNQREVGGALQEIADAGGNDITGALQQVETPAGLRQDYDQLSGQTRPPLAPLAATGNSRFLGTVSGRVQALRTGLASDMSDSSLFAMAGPDTSMGSGRMYDFAAPGQSVAVGNGSNVLADSKWGLWGRGYGLFGDRETERDAPGYTYRMYGASLGLDYQFTEKFLGGVVFGMTNGDVDFAGLRDHADFQAVQVGLYGNLTFGKWYVDSTATYARPQYDTERFVDLTSERLTGDLNGNDWSAYVEAGQNWDLAPNLMLQPLASLQYSYLTLGSYTETGGASALSYDDQSYQSVKGALGARLTRQLFESMSGCRGDGQLRARWVHEFGDSQSSVDTSFASNPATVFTIRDAEIARDSAVVGAGLGANINKQLRVSADYDALLNTDETVQMVSASLQYRW